MKKIFNAVLMIAVVAIAAFAMIGCSNPTSTPPPEPQPLPPTFEEIVVGNSWQVLGIEAYQSSLPDASFKASTEPEPEPFVYPFDKEVCWAWGEESIISYEDLNGDG
ncbi:MAG: hypothetical protein DRJ01_11190, partial [Bacteroidetes bacterium]